MMRFRILDIFLLDQNTESAGGIFITPEPGITKFYCGFQDLFL